MVPPLNWIHLMIISGAAFCIIGLTKIPKIEFHLLGWITVSIRMMVNRFVTFLFDCTFG